MSNCGKVAGAGAGGLKIKNLEGDSILFKTLKGKGFVCKMCENHAGTMQHLIYQTNHVDGLKHLCNKQYTWYTWYGAKKVTKG